MKSVLRRLVKSLKQGLLIWSAIALSLMLWLVIPTSVVSAFPVDVEEQAAILVDLNGEQSIPIYLRPAPNQPTVGYGVSGNPVMVLDQVGDYLAFDDPQATWCHIRVEVKPYLEGWTQAKYLDFDEAQG